VETAKTHLAADDVLQPAIRSAPKHDLRRAVVCEGPSLSTSSRRFSLISDGPLTGAGWIFVSGTVSNDLNRARLWRLSHLDPGRSRRLAPTTEHHTSRVVDAASLFHPRKETFERQVWHTLLGATLANLYSVRLTQGRIPGPLRGSPGGEECGNQM
jgi:hypothetical protein